MNGMDIADNSRWQSASSIGRFHLDRMGRSKGATSENAWTQLD